MRKIAAALLALCLTAGMATTVLANATAGEAQNNIDLINEIGPITNGYDAYNARNALKAVNESAASANSVDWNGLYQYMRSSASVDAYDVGMGLSGAVNENLSLVGANSAFLNQWGVELSGSISQPASNKLTLEINAILNGAKIQPATPIFMEISFPKEMYADASKNTVSITHTKNDGTTETLNPVTLFVDDGKITGCVVVATSFSTFEMTVVSTETEIVPPVKGPEEPAAEDPIKDTSSTMGFTFGFGVLALAIVGMGAATVYTRRKARSNG